MKNGQIAKGMDRSPSAGKRAKKKVTKVARSVTRSGNFRKIVPRSNTSPTSKIHQLCQRGDREGVLKYLRKKPHVIDSSDEMGRTPLQIACLEGHLEVVQLLLNLGCDIDVRERQGWTALHFACACLNDHALKLVQCLIKKGAYVIAENNSGATPLHYLVLNNAYEESALFLEVLTLMIARGADVNSQDKNGETPLHQAALRGLEESIVMLANTRSVNLNLMDLNGETCLHFAARGGHVPTVQILLSMGADSTMAGRNGTCLEIAEHEGHFHLIEFMRDWEAWHRKDGQVIAPPVTDHMGSITYNKKLIEAAEIMGAEPSVAIACLYNMQARGEPTDQLDILMAEINKQKVQTRECAICLTNQVNSLCMPCRHSATCIDCAQTVMEQNARCPICREPIKEILQIYIS